jgi:hypothetical protein
MTAADPLDTLAIRAAADPFFLASSLGAYQCSHGLDDDGLCRRLKCTPAAQRSGLDAGLLAEIASETSPT